MTVPFNLNLNLMKLTIASVNLPPVFLLFSLILCFITYRIMSYLMKVYWGISLPVSFNLDIPSINMYAFTGLIIKLVCTLYHNYKFNFGLYSS